MTGLRHGRLTGLAFSHRDRSGHAHWLFACDCGGHVVADGANVRGGGTTSCGCHHRAVSAARLTVHGHRAARRHEPTYRAWQLMNDSCANPACSSYARRGGRGIAVCAAWRDEFPAFLSAMGERPAGTVLQRDNEDGDFTPDNCRWTSTGSRAARARAGWRRSFPGQGAPGQSATL